MPGEENEQEVHKGLLGEVSRTGEELNISVKSLRDKISSGPDPKDGISFLTLKNGLLLEYNMNLSYLMLKKIKGQNIEGDNAVERLCYLRTVLEKIRPIEHKLKYQIDKFISIAETGEARADDPLRFKANPSLLASKLDDDEDDSADEDDNEEDSSDKPKKNQEKYVAPRNVPQHFDGDKTHEEIEAETEKKKKKTQLSHSMVRELKSQLWDVPEEISHQADTRKQKFIQAQREKEIYEEDNFIRLPITKAERIARKQLSTVSNIGDSLTSFGNSTYEGTVGSSSGDKKRKHSEKKGGKSKKFKKFKKKK